MIERFKDIFTGLERAHGVTKVGHSNGDGTKVQGKSFIKREPVTDELWTRHIQGTDSLGKFPFFVSFTVTKGFGLLNVMSLLVKVSLF